MASASSAPPRAAPAPLPRPSLRYPATPRSRLVLRRLPPDAPAAASLALALAATSTRSNAAVVESTVKGKPGTSRKPRGVAGRAYVACEGEAVAEELARAVNTNANDNDKPRAEVSWCVPARGWDVVVNGRHPATVGTWLQDEEYARFVAATGTSTAGKKAETATPPTTATQDGVNLTSSALAEHVLRELQARELARIKGANSNKKKGKGGNATSNANANKGGNPKGGKGGKGKPQKRPGQGQGKPKPPPAAPAAAAPPTNPTKPPPPRPRPSSTAQPPPPHSSSPEPPSQKR